MTYFCKMDDRKILTDAGRISAQIANEHAESDFEKYRIIQDKLFQSDFDKLIALRTMNKYLKVSNSTPLKSDLLS